MNLNNIKIGQKLALAFAAVVLVIAAMGTAVFLNVLDIENARQEYSAASQNIRTTQEAQFAPGAPREQLSRLSGVG